MIFVIEGVDASGKTTLARCMANKLDCTYVHHTYDSDWTQRQLFEHHLTWLAQYNKGEHMVIDRSWPSCIVYGQVFRGDPNEMASPIVERILGLLGTTYIFALPEQILWEEKFKEMCVEREEMYHGQLDKMIEVYDGYFDLCCGKHGLFIHKANCYAYDMHRHDMEKFADDQIKRAGIVQS